MTEKHWQIITHETPYKVELTRGQRGGYGWTITIRGKDLSDLVDILEDVDKDLRRRFSGGEAAE